MENGKMENEKWKMEKLKMENGKIKMENGKMENLCVLFFPFSLTKYEVC